MNISEALKKYFDKEDRREYWLDLAISDWGQNVGEESRKTFQEKCYSGFWDKYCGYKTKGLDIGYAGYLKDVKPILPGAIGIDTNYPGYDGVTLPFPNNSQDFVYSSHTLEHIKDSHQAINEWFRVTKPGGHVIIVVPHKFLYEKKNELPSQFNEDHKHFFSPSVLLQIIEESLTFSSYRIRHLRDNDLGHVYSDPPEVHGRGQYEIELVLEKLT